MIGKLKKGEAGKNMEAYVPHREREINRINTLRENLLIMRYYVSRRSHLLSHMDEKKKCLPDTALKESLVLLERLDKSGSEVQTEEISDVATLLLGGLQILEEASKSPVQLGPPGDPILPITPESLLASFTKVEIAAALGNPLPENEKGKNRCLAKFFIKQMVVRTVFFFFLALIFHFCSISYFSFMQKEILILSSSFLWALVGSLVWILVRFRRFGAAYTFQPAYAEIFWARVFSGSMITAILMLFIFAGDDPWVKDWVADLPLFSFALGYGGKLQIELLGVVINRIEDSLKILLSKSSGKKRP